MIGYILLFFAVVGGLGYLILWMAAGTYAGWKGRPDGFKWASQASEVTDRAAEAGHKAARFAAVSGAAVTKDVRLQVRERRVIGRLRLEHEAGALSDEEFRDRVNRVLVKSGLDRGAVEEELDRQLRALSARPEPAPVRVPRPSAPTRITKEAWERQRDELVAANRQRTAELRRRVREIESDASEGC